MTKQWTANRFGFRAAGLPCLWTIFPGLVLVTAGTVLISSLSHVGAVLFGVLGGWFNAGYAFDQGEQSAREDGW